MTSLINIIPAFMIRHDGRLFPFIFVLEYDLLSGVVTCSSGRRWEKASVAQRVKAGPPKLPCSAEPSTVTRSSMVTHSSPPSLSGGPSSPESAQGGCCCCRDDDDEPAAAGWLARDQRALEEAAGAHDEVIEVVEDTEEEEQNWAAAAPAPARRALVQPTLHMFFFR